MVFATWRYVSIDRSGGSIIVTIGTILMLLRIFVVIAGVVLILLRVFVPIGFSAFAMVT